MWSDASYEMGEQVTEEDWVPVHQPCRMGYVYRRPGASAPADTVGATAVLSDVVLKNVPAEEAAGEPVRALHCLHRHCQ